MTTQKAAEAAAQNPDDAPAEFVQVDRTVGYLAVRRLGDKGHKGTRATFFDTAEGLKARLSPEQNQGSLWQGFELVLTADGQLIAK
jgi:hypothetical protein